MTKSTNKQSDIHPMRVYNPHGKDFEFEGAKVGEINHAEVGTLEVFKTKGGKWIGSQSHNVMRPNRNFFRAGVFETDDELLEWLGHTKSAKRLADEIGLSASEKID